MDEDEVQTPADFHIYEPANNGTPWKWCVAFNAESDKKEQIENWCNETYGTPADNLYYVTGDETWHNVIPYGEIYLKSDKELFLFNLTWLTNGT